MAVRLPEWTQRLLARYPDAERPSADNPMPVWLEEELKRVPLWAYVRGVHSIRDEPPYYLVEDVRRQPALMREVLDQRSKFADLAERLNDSGVAHLVFTGCGSAFFNSLLGAFLFRHWTGLTTEARESLEFTNYWVPVRGKAALIAQSATGGSIETLGAVQRANDEGMLTIGLTNTPESALESLCTESVAFATGQKCGPDVSVITTRLMMLYQLALELGSRNGTLADDRTHELRHAISTVPDAAERFLTAQEDHVADIAGTLKDQQALLIAGGGPNWYSACEGALKIEEECSMVCRAYRPAEYPHDAIALLSPDVTTVVIAPPGKSYQRLHDSLRTGQAAGSRSVAIVLQGDEEIAGDADFVITVPVDRSLDELGTLSGDLAEMLFPPLAIIVFQLLGYYLAVERGYNPDTLRTDDPDHARAWLTAFPLGAH